MMIVRFFLIALFSIATLGAQEVEAFAAELSRIAYKVPVAVNARFNGPFKVRSHEYDGIRYFTLVGKSGQYLIFRGSENVANWLTNLSVSAVPFEDIKDAKVHSGFYEIAKESVKQLRLNKDEKVVVSGHSLGGAVALLAGAMLHEEGYDVEVVTFGAPPVGNEAFVEAFESLYHVRYEHIFDLVPKADKKSIAALQALLKRVDTDAIGIDALRIALAYLKTMPYEFVHHGEERILTHILTEKPRPGELLDEPVRYHGMKSYLKAFDEESEE